jgi:hypothetical protein
MHLNHYARTSWSDLQVTFVAVAFVCCIKVFRGEPYNFKADTFSFGILLYELLHQRLIMASLIAQQLEEG